MRTTLAGLIVALIVSAIPSALTAQSASEMAEGARVWANNCTRCHNARPPQERTDAEWATIMLHMRARANLTRTDAGLVTSFLTATNLPGVASAPAAEEVVAPSSPSETSEGGEEAESKPHPDLLTLIRYLKTIGIR